MFETPFTKDGKAHGTPEEQWKRRTVLTSNLKAFYQHHVIEGNKFCLKSHEV
jgi:hypothetical protein